MIQIHEPQLQALDQGLDSLSQLTAWLTRAYPTPFAALDQPQTRAMARVAQRRAEAWGARSREAVFAFAALMAAIAPDFDRHAPIAAALTRQPADEAIPSLSHDISPSIWAQIEERRSSIGWRLEAPAWSAPPRERMALAVANAAASVGRPPRLAPNDCVVAAETHGATYAMAGEQAGFILALWIGLAGDGPGVIDLFGSTLQRLGSVHAAMDSLATRLAVEFGVWV